MNTSQFLFIDLLVLVRQPQPLLEPQELRVILINLNDQLDQTTAIQLMNLMLYMISKQSFNNCLVP